MSEAVFVLTKKKVLEQYERLKRLGIKISYSYKTNHEVAKVLQELVDDCDFSIHAFEEIEKIDNKNKIWFNKRK